ncbi:hypothetical protein ACFXKC_28490 [Streptomyces sp. NPDC059340]|uniref:hypothetical protein n=1 Tax=Streptomyces sp. NPDC059340 TaxID=3346806 RepID=UPI0036C6BFAC
MTTDPQPSFRAVFTVTIETRKGGDYYFDQDDLVRNVTPWIEGALEDRDDIRDVIVVEAEPAAPVPPSAPTDRAALSAKLWAIAEQHIVAEWICCEPVDPKHELCSKGQAAIDMARSLLVDADPAKAWNPAAPLLDAVLAELHRTAVEAGPDRCSGCRYVPCGDCQPAVEAPAPNRAGGEGRPEAQAEAWMGATELAPDRVITALAASGLVGYQQNSGRLLHCLAHKPAPASRWADFHEVTAADLVDGGICVHPDCGRDLLAPWPAAVSQPGKEPTS